MLSDYSTIRCMLPSVILDHPDAMLPLLGAPLRTNSSGIQKQVGLDLHGNASFQRSGYGVPFWVTVPLAITFPDPSIENRFVVPVPITTLPLTSCTHRFLPLSR